MRSYGTLHFLKGYFIYEFSLLYNIKLSDAITKTLHVQNFQLKPLRDIDYTKVIARIINLHVVLELKYFLFVFFL